jgi:hypothetical protein
MLREASKLTELIRFIVSKNGDQRSEWRKILAAVGIIKRRHRNGNQGTARLPDADVAGSLNFSASLQEVVHATICGVPVGAAGI